ncbi:MAG: DUF502 domain-containing protein [Candidatus Obscuribacterales bacterium]|nr:DUF502 domain-containing protein [Candidatus Obscuribacterales bacterium]
MTAPNERSFFKSMRNFLIRGVLFIAPVWLCVFLVKLLYGVCENMLGGITAQFVRWFVPVDWLGPFANGHIPGLSMLTAAVMLALIGFAGSWAIGKAGLRLIDFLFMSIPGLNTVYSAARKVIDALAEPGQSRFQKVVLVEGPMMPGLQTIAFVTNEVVADNGERYYWVFIPHMPNPTSGYVFMVESRYIRETTLTTEQGLKICMSLGVLAPPTIPMR